MADSTTSILDGKAGQSALFEQVCTVHGRESVQKYLQGFVQRHNQVGMLSAKLADLETKDNPEAYQACINQIILATQEYYTFIGILPEDMRKLFLHIAQTDSDEEEWVQSLLDDGSSDNLDWKAPLLSLQAIRPKKYIMQIDAITSNLPMLSEQTAIRVGARGGQPILTTVTLDMPDHMKIEGGHVLSTYDKSIINGVTSLMESGNTVFSIPMLYHAMTGKQNPTVDEVLYEELSGKLEQMRRMILTIDLSQEAEARYIEERDGELYEIQDLELEGYLLPINKVTGTINGKRAELYQIIQHPPLYTYSKMKRQLASVRISLLSAPVNNNSTTIPLKTYLLQRIEMMKNPKNSITQNSILFQSIYRELGAEDANKTRKMRIRTYTTTILDYFIEQGYIDSYAVYKTGRSIAGVHITV